MIEPKDLFLETSPNDQDTRFHWTIRRAPPDKPLPLIVLSFTRFGIRTHFWAGRTMPCVRTSCDACDAGRLSRWTGYLACIDPADWSQVLFEYTPPAAEQIGAIMAAQGFLRGTKLVASRTKKVKNGRVSVVSRGIYEHLDRLPEEPEILPILFHIWGIRPRESTTSGAYDRDTLAPHEAPRIATPRVKCPEVSELADACAVDLPGQKRMFSNNGAKKK